MVPFTEQMFSQRLKALSNKKFSFGARPNVSQGGKKLFNFRKDSAQRNLNLSAKSEHFISIGFFKEPQILTI